MIKETIVNHPSSFKEYLILNKYSELVIKMYTRKVEDFLTNTNTNLGQSTDHVELKQCISEYISTFPLSYQKGMIQAALHKYYFFISGLQFAKRQHTTDFSINTSIELEIDRFRKHLSELARLSSTTIIQQCNTVKVFLYCCFQDKDFSPEKVSVNMIRTYFASSVKHLSALSKKTIIVRIRSYIKFLQFADGYNAEEIIKLPMTSAVWKKAGVPKYLTESEIARLLSTYNLNKPIGLRDYAIARCLKDLGLRCSEVAELSLDDFDWIKGTITIKRTKSHSERILPLHIKTGQAIEAYLLQSRPVTAQRTLFVRFKNNQGDPMGTSQVRCTVRTSAIRAGLVHFTGTHMLRHSAAKEMINNGIDLKTIADILGHESIETTSIYTKLDYTQLQEVAGIWPEVMA